MKEKLKVLILEDNIYDAELNISQLKKEIWDLEIRVTLKKEAFVKELSDFDPDIILSDYNLPKYTGIEALELCLKEKPLTPFIIVTGSLDEETAVDCIKKGAWDYVLKEHLVRLNPAVKHALNLSRERMKRKEAEKKIIDNERISRKLLDNIETGVYLTDNKGYILYCNSKAEKITKRKEKDVQKRHIFDALSLTNAEGVLMSPEIDAYFSKMESGGLPFYDEQFMYIDHKTKKKKWISSNFKPIREEDGSFTQVIFCFHDSTEKTIIERNLKLSQDKYRSVFNSVNDAIFLYDVEDFRLIDVNQKAVSLFGYSKMELMQSSIGDISDAENGYTTEKAKEIARKAVNGKSQNEEWRGKTKSGKLFWMQVLLKSIQIDKEQFLMAIIKDIDDFRNAEASLEESKEHYRALVQNSSDVIMRFDKKCRHIYVNDAVKKVVNIAPSKFLNKTHEEMKVFPEELCKFWEKHITKVFDTKKPHNVEFSLGENGQEIFIEWRLFPEFNIDGNISTVLAVARDITDKKISARKLKESEERLNMALEATSEGIWDWNLEDDTIHFSPRYFTMLGYEPDEFEHNLKVLFKLIHPGDEKRIRKYLEKELKANNPLLDMEMRLRRKDGTFAWIRSKAKAFTSDNESSAKRIVGIHEDITHRKRQERIQNVLFKISESVNTTRNLNELFENIQNYLHEVVDTTNCYIALYDKENDTLSLPFLRDEKDDFREFPAGKTMTAYVIKTGKSQLVDVKRSQELEESGLIESIGTPSVSWLGVPLRIKDVIIGVFVIQSYTKDVQYTLEDVQLLEFVSDQIALAIERKQDHDDILKTREKQRKVIESSPDGLAEIDLEGKILNHNTIFPKLFRISPDEYSKLTFFDLVAGDDTIKAQNILNDTLKHGFQKNIEIKMKRLSGLDFYAEVSFGLISEENENDRTIVVVVKNIEERKAYEYNLRIAKEKAEQADRLKTAFLSNMSHEIRTPMNAILGFSELLIQADTTPEEKQDFIQQINFGADTLMQLIADIIDIAKIEAGQIQIHKSYFELSPLLKNLHIVFTKSMIRNEKSELKLIEDNNGNSSSIELYNDELRLKQIMSNLLSNAIKFTEKGEIRYGIRRISESSLTLYVKDQGIGISRKNQSVIFERFRQVGDSDSKLYGGTGLGLAISKHLVEKMGGEIFLESEPGKGSEFYFTIPYHNPVSNQKEGNEEIDISTHNWKGKTILVAEDDKSNFLLMKEILRRTNASIIWARDGNETMDIYGKNPDIDLILLDIQMPGKSGYEVVQEIKNHNSIIPVIAQTAYAMSGERETSLKAGCDDYISKPIKISELMFILNKYLS